MPGLESWTDEPLKVVQDIFEQSQKRSEPWEKQIDQFFSERFISESSWSHLTSLNETPLHALRSGQLVKFRCMIQDMMDPEMYLSVFQVVNKQSGQTRLLTGRYQDVASCNVLEELQLDSHASENSDRLNYYCISIPGESPWVRKAFEEQRRVALPGPSGSKTSQKRSLDESDENADQSVEFSSSSDEGSAAVEAKKPRTALGDNPSNIPPPKSQEDILNFPIPSANGVGCIVKIYESNGSYKINDVIEVAGILAMDPFPVEESEESQEFIHSPGSLIPRLHAVAVRNLSHNNPLIPCGVTPPPAHDMVAAYNELRTLLVEALLGDELVADYLLCHLVSHVYVRKDVLALGKFALNITNVPVSTPNCSYAQRLYQLIENIVTKAHFLPLTLDNMNTLRLRPKKCYDTNRLHAGRLQLSDHTHLILDETALTQGQLNAEGVKNITALGNIINWQKVEYDFRFHQLEFPSNIPVLILSEGRSMLSSDVLLPWRPLPEKKENMVRIFESIDTYLTGALLSKIRTYVTFARLQDYALETDMQNLVQEDFVNARHSGFRVTAEDLHSLLVLARLVCLSQGQNTLTKEIWEKTKNMEAERKLRLQ